MCSACDACCRVCALLLLLGPPPGSTSSCWLLALLTGLLLPLLLASELRPEPALPGRFTLRRRTRTHHHTTHNKQWGSYSEDDHQPACELHPTRV